MLMAAWLLGVLSSISTSMWKPILGLMSDFGPKVDMRDGKKEEIGGFSVAFRSGVVL